MEAVRRCDKWTCIHNEIGQGCTLETITLKVFSRGVGLCKSFRHNNGEPAIDNYKGLCLIITSIANDRVTGITSV